MRIAIRDLYTKSACFFILGSGIKNEKNQNRNNYINFKRFSFFDLSSFRFIN
jgi:hypothetical protein